MSSRSGYNAIAIVCGMMIAGSIVSLSAIISTRNRLGHPPDKYLVAIDAGSSHSQFFIYKWRPRELNITSDVEELRVKQHPFECGHKPGISTFHYNPPEAAVSLQDCLKSAKEALPSDAVVAETPVILRATAGMRVLNEENTTAAGLILEACQSLFVASGFSNASSAAILPGSSEGAYGWVTANYIGRTIKGSATPLGALDLGGASTQITFVPNHTSSIPEDDKFAVTLFDKTYHLYTHSYLCWGANEAISKLNAILITDSTSTIVDNPCLPSGYAYNMSSSMIDDLESGYCTKPIMNRTVAGNLTMRGYYRPSFCTELIDKVAQGVAQVDIVGDFLAFAGYYYPPSFLCTALDPVPEYCKTNPLRPSMYQLGVALNRWCFKTYAEMKMASPETPDSFLVNYCFQGTYSQSLLRLYGFDNNSTDVTFVNKINNHDVGWTLGMILNETNFVLPGPRARVMKKATFVSVVSSSIVLLVTGLILGIIVLRAHYRSGSYYSSLQ